jgi:Protein of unknown function (DUF2835)
MSACCSFSASASRRAAMITSREKEARLHTGCSHQENCKGCPHGASAIQLRRRGRTHPQNRAALAPCWLEAPSGRVGGVMKASGRRGGDCCQGRRAAQPRRPCLSARFGFCWQHADPMNRYEFNLRITADQYLDYYRGTIRHVLVRCSTGQNVQFPASLLQQFVTTEGIHGHFVLTCDEHHRNPRLERLK